MLESTTKCIHSVCRPSINRAKDAFQTKRMLHAAFWHHGAADLNLRTWYTSSIQDLFEPECEGDGSIYGTNTTAKRRDEGLFLDFLYPQKSQAFLRRMSVLGRRQLNRTRRKFIADNPFRAYASAVQSQSTHEPETAKQRHERHMRESASFAKQGLPDSVSEEARARLSQIIYSFRETRDIGIAGEAWSLYSQVKPEYRTYGLTQGLIHVLVNSETGSHIASAVELFESLPRSEIWPSTYSSIIVPLSRVGKLSKAVEVHTKVFKAIGVDLNQSGTGPLFLCLFREKEWQLLLNVWSNCLESPSFEGNESELEEWQRSILKALASEHGFHQRLHDFLGTLSKYPRTMQKADRTDSFARRLISSAFEPCARMPPPACKSAINQLEYLGLATSHDYESAINKAMAPEDHMLQVKAKYAVEIYRLYRDRDFYVPEPRILSNLLKLVASRKDETVLQELYSHWLKDIGVPNAQIASVVMHGLAEIGNVEGVYHVLSQYLHLSPRPSISILNALIHVHARRSDPSNARKQLDRIQNEFGHELDIRAWNTLLNAYENADDLDGARDCFAEILSTGLRPTKYTFATMMALAAHRGDVDFVNQLKSVAEETGVAPSQAMTDATVLAHLKNDNFQEAEAIATAASTPEITDRKTLTRMWNQILAHYSYQPDPINLRSVERVLSTMNSLEIPQDVFSHSAVMRTYVVSRKVAVAQEVMNKHMAPGEEPPQPIHFAILIEGYVNEKLFEQGFRTHAEMLERGLKPTIDTQLALLKLQVTTSLHSRDSDKNKHPGVRFDVLEELFEEIAKATHVPLPAQDTPRLYSQRLKSMDDIFAAYFDTLIALYGKQRSYDVIKTLLEKYMTEERLRKGKVALPLSFIRTLMIIHDRERNHEAVQKYWDFAKHTAYQAAKLNSEASSGTLPSVRRYLLARHFDTYLRSLHAHKPPSAMTDAVQSLFELGFDLDNINWNLYVQLLTQRGLLIEASTLCEQHLMQRFDGWIRIPFHKEKLAQVAAKKSPGLEFTGPNVEKRLKPGQLHATYLTMLRLRKAFLKLQSDSFSDPEKQRLLDNLEQIAPNTMYATKTMPQVEHPARSHIFGIPYETRQKKQLEQAPKHSIYASTEESDLKVKQFPRPPKSRLRRPLGESAVR